MKDFINKHQKTISYILLAITLIINCSLLFSKDPYYGHDIGFHLSRIQSIADCFHNGTFPALIYPNYLNGFGYANGIFYPDLFLYLPAILVFLGVECKMAYHLFMIIVNITTIFSMYFCIYKINRNHFSACVIACIYSLTSYRFTDLYIRSALGETLCFIFMPYVLLGLYEIFYNEANKGYYLIIGLFGILSSHMISLIFCVILIILTFLINIPSFFRNREDFLKRFRYLFIYCLLSVGLTAYFTFPFLEAYLSDTYLFQTNPATGGWDRTIPFSLSILEFPVYTDVYMPVGIGLLFLVLLIMYLFNIRKYKDHKYSIHFLIMGVFFFITSTNLFPWFLFKGFAQYIQFPWRFLILASSCLLFAYEPLITDKITHITFFLIIGALTAFTVACFYYYIFMFHEFRTYDDEVHYSMGGIEYAPSDFDLSIIDENFDYLSNNPIICETSKTGTTIKITYRNNGSDNTYIELPLTYYKGYKAKENGRNLTAEKGDRGILRVYPAADQGEIRVYYGNTLMRILGYLISLLSLIYTVFFLRNERNKV